MNSFIASGNFTLDDVVTAEGLVKRNQLGGTRLPVCGCGELM